MLQRRFVPSPSDTSQTFNATSDLINWGTWGFAAPNVTLSCWVYFNALATGRDDRFISKADGTGAANHDWMLGKTYDGTNHRLRIRALRDGATLVATGGPLVIHRWYHALGIAGEEAGSGVKYLYLDGVQVGFAGGGGTSLASTTNLVYVGNQPTSTTSAPDGLISEPAVWSRALSIAEINGLAKGTLRPQDISNGLEGYLPGGSLIGHRGRNAVSTSTFQRGGPPVIARRRKFWFPTSTASGSTGTLAKTLGNDTLAAAGTIVVTGSLAQTLANATLAAVASTTIRGTLARTLSNDTLAAAGSVGLAASGTLAATLGNDTLAASGTPVVSGALARTLNNDTLASSGTTTILGSLARTLGNDTLAASGSSGSAASGTLAATLSNDTLAATGSPTLIGTFASVLASAALAAAGTTAIVGTLTVTLRNDTLNSAGYPGTPSTSAFWRFLGLVMNRLGF